MEHTKKTKLFEKARSNLIDCHLKIKCTELNGEELDAAKNLISFCSSLNVLVLNKQLKRKRPNF
jgi:hypothetical protein